MTPARESVRLHDLADPRSFVAEVIPGTRVCEKTTDRDPGDGSGPEESGRSVDSRRAPGKMTGPPFADAPGDGASGSGLRPGGYSAASRIAFERLRRCAIPENAPEVLA